MSVDSFTLLCQMRQMLNVLNDDGMLSFVKHLLENGKKDSVMAAIFRQLYKEGDSNSKSFLTSLTEKCNDLLSNTSKTISTQSIPDSKADNFKCLSDDLVCEIGSYLSTKQILTCWTHVNSRCMTLGRRASTISRLDFDGCDDWEIGAAPPKFKPDDIFVKAKYLKLKNDLSPFVTLNNLSSLREIHLGMMYCIYLYNACACILEF